MMLVIKCIANVIFLAIVSKSYSFFHSSKKLYTYRIRHRTGIQISMKENEILNTDNTKYANTIERIAPDKIGLIRWIEESGGSFLPNIESNKLTGGWSIYSPTDIKRGEIIATIPKRICLFSNIEQQLESSETHVQAGHSSGTSSKYVNHNLQCSLLESTQTLIKSLNKKQWRTRLAIALLSERVRSNSNFKMYIRNLPFEFRGVPIFYSSSEFESIQDLALIHSSRERCTFLNEFVQQVLIPVSNLSTNSGTSSSSSQHPFSGFKVDLNSFGWAFSAVSSRAIRNPDDNNSPALVPGIDLISHNTIDPNCEIIITPENYFLISKKDIDKNEELSVSYGPYSNDDLLLDYGFTVNDNSYNEIKIKCDAHLINAARVAMNQGTYGNENFSIKNKYEHQFYIKSTTTSASGRRLQSSTFNANKSIEKKQFPIDILNGFIGRESTAYDEKWLHSWQNNWLSVLQLIDSEGSSITKAIVIKGPKTSVSSSSAIPSSLSADVSSLSQIDGKLLAMLRIIYAKSENEILNHGYTPFTLQHTNSILSVSNELQVMKTLVGILSVMLFLYDTELVDDLLLLHDPSYDPRTSHSDGSTTSNHNHDLNTKIQTFIRSLLYPTSETATTTSQLLINKLRKMKVNISEFLNDYDEKISNSLTKGYKSHINDDNDDDDNEHDNDWKNVEIDIENESSSNKDNTFRNTNHSVNNDTPNDKNINRNSKNADTADEHSYNMKEIIKYRIRKKAILVDLIHVAIAHYERLSKYSSSVANTSETSPLPSLLSNEDKSDRKAKIKDLLNEIRNRDGSQADISAAVERVSNKWLDTNNNL